MTDNIIIGLSPKFIEFHLFFNDVVSFNKSLIFIFSDIQMMLTVFLNILCVLKVSFFTDLIPHSQTSTWEYFLSGSWRYFAILKLIYNDFFAIVKLILMISLTSNPLRLWRTDNIRTEFIYFFQWQFLCYLLLFFILITPFLII